MLYETLMISSEEVLRCVFVIFTAMVPFGELRASIPLAVFGFKMGYVEAFLLSIVGNMIPVLPILLFLERVSECLRKKYAIFDAFFEWLFARTQRQGERVRKYGALALIPFVAIPLPVTGAWTGCAVAFTFGIPRHHAFAAILVGVMIAGVLTTLACMGIIHVLF